MALRPKKCLQKIEPYRFGSLISRQNRKALPPSFCPPRLLLQQRNLRSTQSTCPANQHRSWLLATTAENKHAMWRPGETGITFLSPVFRACVKDCNIPISCLQFLCVASKGNYIAATYLKLHNCVPHGCSYKPRA